MYRCTLAALLLVPTLAAADSLAVVAVAPAPGPAADLAEHTHALRRALAERQEGVLTAEQTRARLLGESAAVTLPEVRRGLDGALAAMQAADYDRAIRSVTSVLKDLDTLPDSQEAWNERRAAKLLLARLYAETGKRQPSRDAMKDVLRVEPEAKVSPAQFPPSFVASFEDVRRELRDVGLATLRVTAASRCTVFVDGRPMGQTPATLSFPPGRYRLAAAAGDMRAKAQVIDLARGDQAVEVDLTLPSLFRPTAGPGLAIGPDGRERAVIRAAVWLGVDRIVSVASGIDHDAPFLMGTLYDARRGTAIREGRVRLVAGSAPRAGIEALAAFLLSGQGSALVEAPGTSTAEPKEGWSTGRKVAVYGGGALAVGTAVGGFFATRANSSAYDDIQKRTSRGLTGADSAALSSDQSTLRTTRVLAPVLFGVAGLAAAGTGVAVFAWPSAGSGGGFQAGVAVTF